MPIHYSVSTCATQVCAAKSREIQAKGKLTSAPLWGALLDTKGPEIRTAMLRDHNNISLEAGQTIIVEAVGDRYTVRTLASWAVAQYMPGCIGLMAHL